MRPLRIIRLLAVLLLVLAAMLAVALTVLFTVDLSAYRAPLEARVSRALGRPVALNGPIRVEPSLTPTVTVQRVTIANPSWAAQPLLAKAQQLSLQFQPWALLRGRVAIERVLLVGARVHLETRPDGTPNWMLTGLQHQAPPSAGQSRAAPGGAPSPLRASPGGPTAASPAPAVASSPLSLPHIEVRRTEVDYRDGRSGLVTRLNVTRALLTADDPHPLQLSIEGTLRGRPLRLVVVGGPWSELVRGVAPWPLRVALETRHDTISAQGELYRRPEPRFDLRLRASGNAFAELAELVGVRVPRLGPFALEARFVRDAKGYAVSEARGFVGHEDAAHRFTVQQGQIQAPFAGGVSLRARGAFRGEPFDLEVDGAPYPELLRQGDAWPLRASVHIARTRMTLDGTVHPRSGDFTIDVRAEGATLSSLDPLLGRDLPPLGPYALTARVLRSRGVLGADALNVRVGRSDAHGSLRLDLTGPQPALSGRLDASTLDLADFRGLAPLRGVTAPAAVPVQGRVAASSGRPGAEGAPPVATPATPASRGEAQAASAPAEALPWFRRPLPLELLQRLDVRLEVHVGRVLGAGTSLQALQGTLRVHGGDLSADNVSLRLAGEALTGRIALNTGQDGPLAVLVVRGEQIRYGPVLAALHLTDRLSGRAERLEFSLRGHGRTLLAIWRSATLGLTARNGDLTYVRPQGGTPVRIAVEQVSANLGGAVGLELNGQGAYRGEPFRLHLIGGGLVELSNDALPWHVRATGSIADASFSVAGSMRAPFSGRGVNLSVHLQGPRLASLGPVVGESLPALGPYSLRGQLSDVPGGVRLEDLQARLGASDAAGELRYVAGARPKITATLTSQQVRLADLWPPGHPAGPVAKAAPSTAPPPEAPAARVNGRGGSRAPSQAKPAPDDALAIPDVRFPVDSLRSVDLNLTLSAAHLVFPATALSDVAVQVRLRRGRLEVQHFEAGAWQGRLNGSLTLDASATPPRVAVSLLAKGVNYQRAMGSLDVGGIEPSTAQLIVRLQGRGPGLREALASSQGTVEFFGDAGQIDSRYLDLWASNMFLALLPSFGEKKTAHLRCAVGHFDVKDGHAETRSLLVDMKRIVIKGVGSVDLKDEHLDFLLWPEAREPGLLRLTTPVRVTGTLRHPDVTPQARGVVEEVAWLLIGANNPFVLLLSYLKPNEVEANPCVAALAAADSKGAQEQNTPPNPISKTVDFFRGLGRFLERSFGGD